MILSSTKKGNRFSPRFKRIFLRLPIVQLDQRLFCCSDNRIHLKFLWICMVSKTILKTKILYCHSFYKSARICEIHFEFHFFSLPIYLKINIIFIQESSYFNIFLKFFTVLFTGSTLAKIFADMGKVLLRHDWR